MANTAITELIVNPVNEKIYGTNVSGIEFDTLVESIRIQGIISPIVITKEKKILSGHRRYFAAKQLGLSKVPTVVKNGFKDEFEEMEAILESNKHRDKTNEQKANEYVMYRTLETAKAKKRQAAAGKKKSNDENKEGISEGAARDLAAKNINWSGKTADAAVKVVGVISQLTEKKMEDEAEKLREELNKSVNKANKSAKIILDRLEGKETEELPPAEKTEDMKKIAKRVKRYAEKIASDLVYVKMDELTTKNKFKNDLKTALTLLEKEVGDWLDNNPFEMPGTKK